MIYKQEKACANAFKCAMLRLQQTTRGLYITLLELYVYPYVRHTHKLASEHVADWSRRQGFMSVCGSAGTFVAASGKRVRMGK